MYAPYKLYYNVYATKLNLLWYLGSHRLFAKGPN